MCRENITRPSGHQAATAAALLCHRAEHKLSQRELAKRLGVSQPRVVKLESGEHNPEAQPTGRPKGGWRKSPTRFIENGTLSWPW